MEVRWADGWTLARREVIEKPTDCLFLPPRSSFRFPLNLGHGVLTAFPLESWTVNCILSLGTGFTYDVKVVFFIFCLGCERPIPSSTTPGILMGKPSQINTSAASVHYLRWAGGCQFSSGVRANCLLLSRCWMSGTLMYGTILYSSSLGSPVTISTSFPSSSVKEYTND